jgi:hypothetical protein
MASFLVGLVIAVVISGIFSFKNDAAIQERNSVENLIISGGNLTFFNNDTASPDTTNLMVYAIVDLTDFDPSANSAVRCLRTRYFAFSF